MFKICKFLDTPFIEKQGMIGLDLQYSKKFEQEMLQKNME